MRGSSRHHSKHPLWPLLLAILQISTGFLALSLLPHSITNPDPPPELLHSSIASRPLPTCKGYSAIFCETLNRFDELTIPERHPPDNGAFALFLLVRDISIIQALVEGSRDFFASHYFDSIFIFNEENRSGPGEIEGLSVHYVDVHPLWSTYPPGFDPNATVSHWIVRHRKWSYHQMIRFFWKTVFTLPEISNVTAYMRLDGDSCLGGITESPRNLLNDGVVYIKNNDFVDMPEVVENLESLTRDYVRYFGIEVRWKGAWDGAYFGGAAVAFYNNMEIMDIRFWMRPDVQHFVHFVDTSWGIYRHRWGDAPLRYIALAIFANERMVRDRPHTWHYHHPCRVN
jgi:hypothetical protein